MGSFLPHQSEIVILPCFKVVTSSETMKLSLFNSYLTYDLVYSTQLLAKRGFVSGVLSLVDDWLKRDSFVLLAGRAYFSSRLLI